LFVCVGTTDKALKSFGDCSRQPPFVARAGIGRGTCFQVAPPQSIAVALAQPVDGPAGALRTRRVPIVRPPPQNILPPGKVFCSRITSVQEIGVNGLPQCGFSSRRHVIETGKIPVTAFVVASPCGVCPAPPVSTRTATPLPCSVVAGLPPSPTCGTLPDVQHFKHLDIIPGTGAQPPDAEALPELVMVFVRSVTSLEGVIPRTLRRMAVLPQRHSFREALGGHSRFRRAETESSRLPIDDQFSRFGTVFDLTYWQALIGPLMVELFTALDLPRMPKLICSGRTRHRARAPHASRG
jgi:hypothetical protein